jgi:alpha-glucoside transport system permease protein
MIQKERGREALVITHKLETSARPVVEKMVYSVASIGIVIVLIEGFLFLRDSECPQVIKTFVAIVWGVGGIAGIYWVLYRLLLLFPTRIRVKVEPYVFVAPALLLLGWFLTLPVIRTAYLSFFGAASKDFVGLSNYTFVFTDRSMLVAWRNNLLWMVFGTSLSVIFGFVIALTSDRVGWEKTAKTIIFMPMAISMVGAGIIWRFMYAYDPNIGLLNALVQLFNGSPKNWLILRPINTFFLIAVFIWGQTGFAMVVLSAAIKGVPKEIVEAATIDGAGDLRRIKDIIIPSVKSSIVTVSTTIVIGSLKTFDVVFTMTQGLDGTEVLASQQYKQMFRYFNYGRGAAIAMIIFLAVIPVIIYNIRQFQKGGNI